MTSKQYNKFINEFVKNWYKITNEQKKQFQLWEDYFKKNPFSFLNILPYRYFPEPYIGNPLSKKLKAVFINLNPGLGGAMQDVFNNDALSILNVFNNNQQNYKKTINQFILENEVFFATNKNFNNQKLLKNQLKKYKAKYPNISELKPLHDTYAWWHDNRLLWLKDILELKEPPSLNEIIGIELTPWHSTNFAEMGNTAKEDSIWQYVLKPCIELSKNIEEGLFKKGSKSIVISKGSALKNLLSEKNLKKLSETFPELKDNTSSIKQVSKHTNWYQWKFSCPETQWQCFILVYTKPGYDMKIEQGEKVKGIFENILSDNV